MPDQFYISSANPIRFYPEEDNYNPGVYYIRQMDDAPYFKQIRDYQLKVRYNQKYTLEDDPMIQIMSDYDDIICELVDYITKQVIDTYAVTEIANNLVGQTFKVYQFTCDFMDEGLFFLRLKYNNSTKVQVSEPLEIKSVHPNTLRFEYTNSINDFSLIFNSDFIGLVRCEGDILEFNPSSDNTIYADQIHSVTLTHSVAYRKYSLIIGGNVSKTYGGIPDYMADIVNRVLSCNQVKIDGKYFTKSEGSDWEELRFENYPLSAQRIQISESENKFQLEFTNPLPIEDMAYVYRKLSFIGNNANITINNILKKYNGLVKVCFRNVGDPVEVTIKTTTTGSSDDFEITRVITSSSTTIDINQFFASDKIVTITSEAWSYVDIFVVYEKLDAVNSSSVEAGGIGIGSVIIYEEQDPGDFALDFDLETGLGNTERAFNGYAICDGRHGTKDRRGKLSRAVDGITEGQESGLSGGSNTIALEIDQLPEHYHKMFGDSSQAAPSPGANNIEPYIRPSATTDPPDVLASMGGKIGYDQMRISKSTRMEPELGRTGKVGSGADVDVTNEYTTDIYIKRIF